MVGKSGRNALQARGTALISSRLICNVEGPGALYSISAHVGSSSYVGYICDNGHTKCGCNERYFHMHLLWMRQQPWQDPLP